MFYGNDYEVWHRCFYSNLATNVVNWDTCLNNIARCGYTVSDIKKRTNRPQAFFCTSNFKVSSFSVLAYKISLCVAVSTVPKYELQ